MPGGKGNIMENLIFQPDTIVLCCCKDSGKIGNDNFLGGMIVNIPPLNLDSVGLGYCSVRLFLT